MTVVQSSLSLYQAISRAFGQNLNDDHDVICTVKNQPCAYLVVPKSQEIPASAKKLTLDEIITLAYRILHQLQTEEKYELSRIIDYMGKRKLSHFRGLNMLIGSNALFIPEIVSKTRNFLRGCGMQSAHKRAENLGKAISRQTVFASFPPDLLLHIFKNLSAKQICLARSVCKLWSQVGAESALWRVRCEADFGIFLHDANKPALETYQYWLGVKAKSDLLLYGFPKDAFKFGSGHAASWLYDKLSGKLIVGLQPPIDLRPDGSVRFSQYSVFMHDFVEDRSKSFDQVPIAAARVEHVAYDQAARKIVGALAYSKEVIIWNEDDYKIEQRFSTSDKVASLHYDGAKGRIFAGCINGIIQSWDIQNAAQMQFTGDASIQITYDPKREQIYACSSVCLSIFSAATGKRIQSVQGEFKQGFFFDSQCDALIACSSDHCIAKYELQNLKVERTFAVPEDERIRLYHYDEISRRIIAVAGAATKENLCIWDSMLGACVGRFEIPAHTEIKAIHYIPASRLIATLDTSGSLRIWSEGNDPVIEHPNVCRRHGEKYTLDIDVERGRILAAGYKSRSRVPLRYWESVF